MPGFYDLPNEVHYRTIHYIQPGDILNFSGCCRLTRLLANTAVNEHLELTLRYKHLLFGDQPGSLRGQSVRPRHYSLSLLRDIIISSWLSYYPKEMTIGSFLARDELVHGGQDRQSELLNLRTRKIECTLKEHGNALRSTIAKCRYKNHAERNVWLQSFKRRAPQAMYVLLLLLLPNLQKIEFVGDPFHSDRNEILKPRLDKAIQTYTVTSAEYRISRSTVNVSTYTFPPFHKRIAGLKSVEALPSLRSMSAKAISETSLGNDNYLECLMRKPLPLESYYNLSEIHFCRCTVMPLVFDCLFNTTKSLEKFAYALGGDEFTTFRAHDIIKSLSQHYSHSLRDLHITAAFAGTDTWYKADGKFEFDLKPFERLETLRVDNTLFQDYSKQCHQRCEEKRKYCQCPRKTLHFVDVLPHSIVNVILEGPVSLHRAMKMSDGLVAMKNQWVPHLKNVFIRDTPTSSELTNITRDLLRVGVRLYA